MMKLKVSLSVKRQQQKDNNVTPANVADMGTA